jgi:hypothetical protein
MTAVAPVALEITTGRKNGGGQITAGRNHRPRGYDLDYRPHRKTRILLGQVEEVLAGYVDYLPLSVRQIFYRLVGQYGYEKTENAYARLSEALVRARRAKMIPFATIRDDGIVTIENTFYRGIADFQDETARRIRAYRRDRQEAQLQFIELWCEAAGMLPQLARVAARYSVPVYSAGGFSSLSGNYAIRTRGLGRSVPTVILHVGDFDPSGESIFTAMTEDAAAFVEADRVIGLQRIEAERVALTAGQVDRYQLETAPPKATDKRSKNWNGGTCQLEALAPNQLANIVVAAIESYMDAETYDVQIAREDRERAELLALPPGESAPAFPWISDDEACS